MPIIKSAKKRVKTATKARARNSRTKRSLRDALKAFTKAVDSGKAADIQKAERDAVSAIDTAAKKAIIHKNKAARQKSALAAKAKAVVRQGSPSKAGVKPGKVVAKKAPAKPTAAPKKAPKTPAKKAESKK